MQKNDIMDDYNHHHEKSIERERMKINMSLMIASGRYKKMRINDSINLLERVKNKNNLKLEGKAKKQSHT